MGLLIGQARPRTCTTSSSSDSVRNFEDARVIIFGESIGDPLQYDMRELGRALQRPSSSRLIVILHDSDGPPIRTTFCSERALSHNVRLYSR